MIKRDTGLILNKKTSLSKREIRDKTIDDDVHGCPHLRTSVRRCRKQFRIVVPSHASAPRKYVVCHLIHAFKYQRRATSFV